MKLGILTDIHEHVENLQAALQRFKTEQIDQVIVIGDLFRTGEQVRETCRLLDDAHAIGVWGNHDYGLCVDPDKTICARYGDDVIRFMSSLRPRLEFAECHFMHVEPWLNPEDVADLWYYEGPPDEHGKLQRIFDAVPNRLMFAGHFHKWLAASPDGIQHWHGYSPIDLSGDRFFVVIGALCEGQFAILDTETSVLTPVQVQ